MPRGFDPFRARPTVAVQANTGLRNEMVMMKMVRKKVDIGLKNETTIKEAGKEDDDDVPDDNDDDDNFR